MDLDNFKRVNDEKGHEAGDEFAILHDLIPMKNKEDSKNRLALDPETQGDHLGVTTGFSVYQREVDTFKTMSKRSDTKGRDNWDISNSNNG